MVDPWNFDSRYEAPDLILESIIAFYQSLLHLRCKNHWFMGYGNPSLFGQYSKLVTEMMTGHSPKAIGPLVSIQALFKTKYSALPTSSSNGIYIASLLKNQ